MKIEQFILLKDSEKSKIVFETGAFLKNYQEGNYSFDLYVLDDFCVSFCFDLTKKEKMKIIAHNVQERYFCQN